MKRAILIILTILIAATFSYAQKDKYLKIGYSMPAATAGLITSKVAASSPMMSNLLTNSPSRAGVFPAPP